MVRKARSKSVQHNLRVLSQQPSQISGRKTSFGDYDSELVDGRYVTSVPILSPDDEDREHRKVPGGGISSRGNLRSEGSKGLRDLKKSTQSSSATSRKGSIIDRWASNTMF